MKERFKPHAAVYGVLRKGDQILLMRRQGSIYFNGWYGLPSGHLEEGETLREATVRELKEELVIDFKEFDLTFAHLLHRYSPTDDLGEARKYLDVFFTVNRWEGEPTIGEPAKCDELLWVPLSKLPDNTVPYVRDVLQEIDQSIPYSEHSWEKRHT